MNTTEQKTNELNIAAIHPSNGDKYSPNLHAWLTNPDDPGRVVRSRVFIDKNQNQYIGFMDGTYLIGSRLVPVLCNGRKERTWAFGHLGRLTEITDFWPRYARDGRCAIDTAHAMHFVGEGSRWRVEQTTQGARRECQWCGHIQVKLVRTEVVAKSEWVPV